MNKQDFVDRVTEARNIAAKFPTALNIRNLASALRALGNYAACKENNYLEAVSFYEEARSIYDLIGDNEGKAKAYFNLYKIYEIGLNDNEMAYSYIKKALEFVKGKALRAYYEYEYDCLKVTGLREGWL